MPYNALHDRGYPSFGCAPCIRVVAAGKDIRAGRWWWESPESKECGLHVGRDGRLAQSKWHLYLSRLLSIRDIVVAVNKMDRLDYRREALDAVRGTFTTFAEQLGIAFILTNESTTFVFGFLGNLNLFRGRARDGWLQVGEASFAVPEHRSESDVPAVAYVRPHEVEIEPVSPGGEGIPAQLSPALIVGPTARLDLERDDNAQIIEAELPAHRDRALDLKLCESLWVRPREMRAFIQTRKKVTLAASEPLGESS